MEGAQLQTSKSSENVIAFPRYRRSHLKSQTYSTLLTILSHCDDYENSRLSCSPQSHTATQEPKTHDDGVDKMGRENQERESECLKFVGPDVIDPNNPIFSSKSNAPERFEGVGVQGGELSDMKIAVDDVELMMGLQDDEGFSGRQDMMIYESGGVVSPEANDMTKEQKLMCELEQIVKGSEKLVCDSGLSPPNVGLVEKQNSNSEVELMDNRVEGLEFEQSNLNKSGPSGESQVKGEFNQHASEGFQSSLSANISKSSINEQSSLLEISACNINYERQQKEMAIAKPAFAAMSFPPPISEGSEFEEGKHHFQKDTEIIGISLNQDMISEMSNLNESGGDRKLLLDTGSLNAKDEMHHTEEQSRELSCDNDAATSSSPMIEGVDVEEGEIFGDLGMDENLEYMSSVDISMSLQNIEDEITRPKIVTEKNIISPCNIRNAERDYKSTSFIIDELQDTNDSGEVEPRESERKWLVCGVGVVEPGEANSSEKTGDYGLVPEPAKSKDRDDERKEVANLPAALAYNQVLQRELSEEEDTGDDGNLSTAKKAGVDHKKKRGPLTETRKAKRKQQKRKKRAEKNRQLGVKRLKLLPVQKPKPVEYCRHYLKGKCYEGDKCKFSHDTVPLTKSKPCCHFARHSCMKGDECPFDHQLSKYPCSNFVSKGSCSRGDACLFSHKMPTKEDISPASNECRSELKPSLLPVNTNSSKLHHVNGCNTSLQNHLSDSGGTRPPINIKHEAADVVRKPLTQMPKGISFINVSKSSPSKPSTGTLEQGMVAAKESVVQIKTHTDKSLSGTAQNLEETAKKMPAVAPKGINFLSFGKGYLSSSKISVSSFLNKENVIKLPQLENFGLPEPSSLSLNEDDHGKVGDMLKQSVLQTVLFSDESLKRHQSAPGGMNSDFPGKAFVDKSATDIQGSLTSHPHHILSKSTQEGVKESDNSHMSTGTLSGLPLSPFVLDQSSESLASGHHKYVSNSAQKALFSTLAFAAKHEPDIKMK